MHFNTDGELIAGIHYTTLDELSDLLGFSEKRKEIIISISEVAEILKSVGCPTLYIDGSFATSWKEMPGDWDGCYECNGDPNDFLTKIQNKEPLLLPLRMNRLKQKVKYQCDLFPSWFENTPGETFLEFFQHTRDGKPKGIIAIKLSEI